MNLGTRLQSLLKDKKISQEVLAQQLGVAGKSTISAWINDRAKPSADLLVKLAEFLNTTPNYLLLGGEERSEIEALKRENALQKQLLESKNETITALREANQSKNIAVVSDEK